MKIRDGHCILGESDILRDVFSLMRNNNVFHGVVLHNDKTPIGVLYYEDFLNCDTYENETVKKIMRRDFTVLNEKTKLDDFLEEQIDSITFPMIVIDDEGEYKGMLTDRRLLEMLYNELKYTKRILDNIDEGIIAIDANDNITYINESWKKIHGVYNNELIGENVIDKFPETGFGTEKMNDTDIEPIHLNFSGATVMPSYKSIVDSDNQPMGAMAIVKDYNKINNIYIGINQINKVNVMFNSMFDYLFEAVVCVDKSYRIVYCNKSFSNLFNVKSGDLLPDNKIKRMIKEEYKAEKIDAFSVEIEIAANESNRVFNVSGMPIVDVRENLDGIVLILHDITRIKKLDDELEMRSKMLDYYNRETNCIPDEMICESEGFRSVISTALKVAPTSAAVLIEGENGVGKELVAKLIHNNSDRKEKAFIPVNCGAIPEALWESEMFGYEEGAFTGAKKGGKIGVFEMADGGTVFLDEISEMSLATQVKMLRFLQNMEIAKVGRKEVKMVDVRIIAASNKNIEKMVDEELFRIDLYYRLNVVKLKIPPLRDRVVEIKPLVDKYISMFNERYNKNVGISEEALILLESEEWPGNIRQLRNMIEQSVIMCDGAIEAYDLPINRNITARGIRKEKGEMLSEDKRWDIPYRVALMEKELIREALKASDNNKSKAMKMLNISRKTFYKKIKDYGLENSVE